MIKVEISDPRTIPATIYRSQNKNKLSSIRCFLYYNNILPVYDFSIKIYVKLDDDTWKSSILRYELSSKISRSLKGDF